MAEQRHPCPERPLFRPRHRLTRATEFREAYCRGTRLVSGPLALYIRPNHLPQHRLGLSVGRRVGGAVARNRLKRLLREAFRLVRPDLPSTPDGAYDIVVSVRPHRPLPLAAYKARLLDLVTRAHRRQVLLRSDGESTDAPV